MISGKHDQWKEGKYFCCRGWITKFLEVVMQADNFGHIVNPFVQDFLSNGNPSTIAAPKSDGIRTITPL